MKNAFVPPVKTGIVQSNVSAPSSVVPQSPNVPLECVRKEKNGRGKNELYGKVLGTDCG